MGHESHNKRKLKREIATDKAWLGKKYGTGVRAKKNLAEADADLQQFDKHNPEFREMCFDVMEGLRSGMYIFAIVLAIPLDYLTTRYGLELISSDTIAPLVKKVVPSFLVIFEIMMSYFTASSSESLKYGAFMNKVHKYLPYFIIVFLWAISAIGAIYAVGVPDWEKIVARQGLLAIACTIMHLWIVRHSEDMVSTFGLLVYKFRRSSYKSTVSHEARVFEKSMYDYTDSVPKVAEKIDAFREKYPDDDTDFTSGIPTEQINAINKIMGRDVFGNRFRNRDENQIN